MVEDGGGATVTEEVDGGKAPAPTVIEVHFALFLDLTNTNDG